MYRNVRRFTSKRVTTVRRATVQCNQACQSRRELHTDRQRIGQQNARQQAQRITTVPQEEAPILREQNSPRHAERRTEMTPEERSQAREINAGQQRA